MSRLTPKEEREIAERLAEVARLESLRAADTETQCPQCLGKGYSMTATDAPAALTYTGPRPKGQGNPGSAEHRIAFKRQDCDLCRTKGSVTVSLARSWKSANPARLR